MIQNHPLDFPKTRFYTADAKGYTDYPLLG